MLKTYTWPRFPFRPAPQPQPRVPLVVVGAGPVGLCAAIDAALRGQPVVLLDEDDTVSLGSRGVCYAQRTLQVLDRLGVGAEVVARGVTWNVGRTFHGEREVFAFDLQPEPGHRRPGMVNLQQYHLEEILVRRAGELPLLDLRWKHRVTQVRPDADGATLEVATPEGPYTLRCDWLVVADGAKSPIRRQLGLDIDGQVFPDRFLIADVVLGAEPFGAGRAERRFWFDPVFHDGGSALMHRQADRVWRLDFQLGPDADPEREKQPERVAPRVRAALDAQGLAYLGFELEWCSVYSFQCRRMARFRHGRLLFAGDAAHQVSPFGARGANSGIQDADNLMWKLDLVLRGQAPEALLDSYDAERGFAADENLRHSTRSTDFMTPRTHASRVLREAVLTLAAEHPFARTLVNSGRLSVPATLADSPLNTPDAEAFEGWMVPGAPADDAPLPGGGWLLAQLPPGFVLLWFAQEGAAAPPAPVPVVHLPTQGLAAQRFGAREGSCVLLRPDQHVAARWHAFQPGRLHAALARAMAQEPTP